MTKKQNQIAKSLFKKSLDSQGFISNKKVREILKEMTARKPQGLTKILKIYKHLIEEAIAKEEIIILSASKVPHQKKIEKEILEKTAARKVLYKKDPKIVFGAKIIHNDWIYDATLDAKLKQLTHLR